MAPNPVNSKDLARRLFRAHRYLPLIFDWPVTIDPNRHTTLCYVIVLPGLKSPFRAGLRPAGGPISVPSRQQSGQNPAPEALLRIIV